MSRTTSNRLTATRRAGEYPGDLPFRQAEKFNLVLNLRTARELGVTFPTYLLDRADQVIEA